MKKFIYLFILIITLNSCESEDDSSSDPIVGTWQLTSIIENGEEIATDCEKENTVTFSSNATFTIIDSYDNGNNSCSTDTATGSWKNKGNSNYSVTIFEKERETKVNFSKNNTVWSSTNTDSDGGTTYTTTETYKKI